MCILFLLRAVGRHFRMAGMGPIKTNMELGNPGVEGCPCVPLSLSYFDSYGNLADDVVKY